MKRARSRNPLAAVAAAVLSAAMLAGCSIGPVNLDDVAADFAVIGEDIASLLSPTTVQEAKEQRRSQMTPVVSSSDLHTAGTLTVGIRTTESAPLAILSSDGSYAGIDVDMAYALADQLGLSSVEFVSVSGVTAGLEGGCDVVMGAKADDEAGLTVVEGYAQSSLGVFARGDATAPIDAAELGGKTIGVQSGSISQSTLAGLDLAYTERTFANLNDAFAALDKGEVDFVVCDALSGAYLACTTGGISFVGTVDDPVSVGIAVSSSATGLQSAVQTALDALQSNGVGDIARSRWVGALPTLSESTKVTGLATKPAEEGTTGDEAGDEADATEGDVTSVD